MLYQLLLLSLCDAACTAEFYDLPKDDYTPERHRNDGEELKKRTECFMDRAPCTHITGAYRKEMVMTACIKCSPELKSLAQAYLNGVNEKYPASYKELMLKYDPTNTKFNAFESAVGVIKTILSSLPALPSGASLPSIPSVPSVPIFYSITSLTPVSRVKAILTPVPIVAKAVVLIINLRQGILNNSLRCPFY